MRLRSLLADPLRALVALEAVAIVASYPVDVFIALMHFYKTPGDPKTLAIYTIQYIIAAIALFSIPHRPNRRYLAVAVAVCMVAVLAEAPTGMGSVGPIVAVAVLAYRLTFAFGFRGTALAWLIFFASMMFDPVRQYAEHPVFNQGMHLATTAIEVLVVTILIYGLVGIMWLYARNNAAMAAAAERSRIALDLHDSLGHALTTLGVHLENANRLALTDVDKAKTYMARAGELTREVLADVRDTVAMLHEGEDEQRPPLSSLLDRLRSDFAAADIDLRWRVSLEREPLGRSAHVLYRVLQEALTNVARHAHARRVDVEVRGDNDEVHVSVEDDGRGFDKAGDNGHGLVSMRTRVESVAGTINIGSRIGAGTRVHATIPLEGI